MAVEKVHQKELLGERKMKEINEYFHMLSEFPILPSTSA